MLALVPLFKGKKELWKKIFKCTIAYEIGTILILIPSVNRVAGSPPYLVPLGTLFFNASGTAGNQIIGMILNIFMMLPPAIWSALISYLCVLYNRALITHPSLYSNGAGVIASISFSLCIFIIAYCRLKYPRLFIPALQGFTLPFFTLTKGIYSTEFDIMNVVGTFYPILIGGALALLSNLLFWPETAAKASEIAFGSSMESIKDVLLFVHEDLLKNDDAGVMTGDVSTSSKLQTLNSKLQKDIASMKSARQDAKYELIVSYYSPETYKPLLISISTLAQNLFGFSLAVKREVRILLEKKVKAHFKDHQSSDDIVLSATSRTLLQQQQASILSGNTLLSGREYKDIDRLQSCIQPALKRFISTCIFAVEQIENDLIKHKAITVDKKDNTTKPHSSTKINLVQALEEFKETELLLQNEYEQVAIVPTEDHFLIFTVIFTMTQFGEELIRLQGHAQELVLKSNNEKKQWILSRIYLPRVPFVRWLSRASSGGNQKEGESLSERAILDHRELELRNSRHHPHHHKAQQEEEANTLDLRKKVTRLASRIEEEQEHEKNDSSKQERDTQLDKEEGRVPLQHTVGKHFWNRKLYSLTKWFQYGPTHYAIKFTIIMTLLALMAFLPISGANEFYNNNHGQWALLSAMVVVNYTVGSTSVQCFYRIVATICGALCGYISLLASQRNQNPYVLSVLVFVFQIPMWYSLLDSKYPRIGFISLLTMAVITSTGYSNSLNESIFEPVWKRTITAIFAIIIVMLVDGLVWPVWARKRLRVDLADLLIATGIQYSRVVSLVCQENTKSHRYVATFEEAQKNQKSLLRQMLVVQEMLALTEDEPRLTKGSFPIKEYQQILDHERNILYWIGHIQLTQALISSSIRKSIMNPLNAYRKEMAAAVHLYLFTLACSLRTKSSLPASLPSAEMARRMLQFKQIEVWKKENHGELLGKESTGQTIANQQQHAEHQLFWHTYAAGCTEVVVEQEAMGDVVSRLMGQYVFKAATKDWISTTQMTNLEE